MDLRTAHTADLPPADLEAARVLMAEVFAGEWTAEDWEHALGGVHILAWDGETPAGHAAVVARRLLYRRRALRAGYVEAVAVRADRRRQGVATALMREAARIIRGGYEVGALGASEQGAGLYPALGWQRWQGPLSALTPDGLVATPEEEGDIYVLEVGEPLDLTTPLACDWRDGDLW
jgi:aminoglycoside 2'-N-acetyltransferase I